MASSDFVIVILAAGKGVRLRSGLPKVLHPAGGRTLIEHVIRACRPLKPRSIVAVVGHGADQVSAVLEPLGVRTILQQPAAAEPPPRHARSARRAIGSAKFAIVLPGDAPLITPTEEHWKALVRTHRQGAAAATILSAEVANPAGYGRILRRARLAQFAAIVEDRRSLTKTISAASARSTPACMP